MFHVLYNPHAGNETGEASSKDLIKFYKEEELTYHDTTLIEDKGVFVENLPAEDGIIVCGGDGTVHRFANETYGKLGEREVLYFATGSGNDFLTDIGGTKGDKPVKINQYLVSLPKVTVNGKEYRFVNNVGFGIDGYCCEEGDRLRGTTDKPINYTAIAIKGLLMKFKPLNATVTVDGVTKSYKKAWMAPTMNGRYYGGGMIPTPNQDRLDKEKYVSTLVFYGKGPLPTLIMFPTIFKGEHVKYTKSVEIKKGHHVNVKFDKPCALQIDGETILGVTEYTVDAENRD